MQYFWTFVASFKSALNAIYNAIFCVAFFCLYFTQTIGGHLVAPFPDYDLVPLLMAVGSKVHIVDTGGMSCLNGHMIMHAYSY